MLRQLSFYDMETALFLPSEAIPEEWFDTCGRFAVSLSFHAIVFVYKIAGKSFY
jgi:hypothetical protein